MADMTCAVAVLSLAFQSATTLPKAPVALPKVTSVTGPTASIPSPKAKGTVLIFVGVDCPIANRLSPEIGRIIKEYSAKEIDCWLVYPDRELKSDRALKHMQEFGLSCMATIDRKRAITKAVGATVTPQAAILDAKGHVKYLGRINDLFAEHGKTNPEIKSHDLRVSLDALLAGKPIPNPITEAVGCYFSN
jgi:hypothetical protein